VADMSRGFKALLLLAYCAMTLPIIGIPAFATSESPRTLLTDGEKAMKGVRRVGLVVDLDDQAGSAIGLNAKTIKERIGSQLKRAGLVVISDQEVKREPGRPTLRFVVADIVVFTQQGSARTVASEELQFTQDVGLIRQNGLMINRPVWRSLLHLVYFDGSSNVDVRSRLMLSGVDKAAQAFLTAYRKANPKTTTNRKS
jgi:hypothetical protein